MELKQFGNKNIKKHIEENINDALYQLQAPLKSIIQYNIDLGQLTMLDLDQEPFMNLKLESF